MRTIYIADDGQKFTSQKACEDYERRMKSKFSDYPIVADCYGGIINLKALLTNENNTDEIIKCELGSIYYIYATENTEEAYKNLCKLMMQYDFELPNFEDVFCEGSIALYYEEDWHEGWKNYYDLESKFYKIEGQFNIMF